MDIDIINEIKLDRATNKCAHSGRENFHDLTDSIYAFIHSVSHAGY